jgi:hypothetical protein
MSYRWDGREWPFVLLAVGNGVHPSRAYGREAMIISNRSDLIEEEVVIQL